MNREIVLATTVAKTAQPMAAAEPDPYSAQLLKLIPAEVVAVFLAIDGLLASSVEASRALSSVPPATGASHLGTLFYALVAVCAVATALHLRVFGKVANRLQIGLTVLAFAVWVLATSATLRVLIQPPLHPSYGGTAVAVFTLVAPLILRLGSRTRS